jgi:hypothetical protein
MTLKSHRTTPKMAGTISMKKTASQTAIVPRYEKAGTIAVRPARSSSATGISSSYRRYGLAPKGDSLSPLFGGRTVPVSTLGGRYAVRFGPIPPPLRDERNALRLDGSPEPAEDMRLDY